MGGFNIPIADKPDRIGVGVVLIWMGKELEELRMTPGLI